MKKCLRALDVCDGVVRRVSDQEILDAKAQVGAGGIGCEPASAASVAGAKLLREEGVIAPSDRVVCILTGHQLKDPTATVAYHTTDQEKFNEVLGSRGVSRASFAQPRRSCAQRVGCDHSRDPTVQLKEGNADKKLMDKKTRSSLPPAPLILRGNSQLASVFLDKLTTHPNVFRKRIRHIEGQPGRGDWVALYYTPADADGERGDAEPVLFGYGLYNPKSEIAVRILRWHHKYRMTLFGMRSSRMPSRCAAMCSSWMR